MLPRVLPHEQYERARGALQRLRRQRDLNVAAVHTHEHVLDVYVQRAAQAVRADELHAAHASQLHLSLSTLAMRIAHASAQISSVPLPVWHSIVTQPDAVRTLGTTSLVSVLLLHDKCVYVFAVDHLCYVFLALVAHAAHARPLLGSGTTGAPQALEISFHPQRAHDMSVLHANTYGTTIGCASVTLQVFACQCE